jgi:hypothetical protein
VPRIKYQEIAFTAKSLEVIGQANRIIAQYAAQGFDLTLRQLYYQFVSRDLIPNRQSEYKRLGSIVNDARLAGLIDWSTIVDRTRELVSVSHWDDPSDIVDACAKSFRVDKWENQTWRPEVWIEKDALVGVIEGVCTTWDVPFFSCRGYTSQSEMWAGAMRLKSYQKRGQKPYIIHLGDHDPSGKDMSRDIADRMAFFGVDLEFKRIALNMDQVEQYSPPPNPAKITDSRAEGYIAEFGAESWELDALSPTVLAALIRDAIDEVRDEDQWTEDREREDKGRGDLAFASKMWDSVESHLAELREEEDE